MIALIVAVIAGGWGYVMWPRDREPPVSAEVITFDASAADSAEITFTVQQARRPGGDVPDPGHDIQHLEVGSREVEFPRAGRTASSPNG